MSAAGGSGSRSASCLLSVLTLQHRLRAKHEDKLSGRSFLTDGRRKWTQRHKRQPSAWWRGSTLTRRTRLITLAKIFKSGMFPLTDSWCHSNCNLSS